MDDFERRLGRAQDTLGNGEKQLRRLLERLNADTSGLGALGEMRSWIEVNRPDLRRRSQTIRTEQTVWDTSRFPLTGLSAFDETRYGKVNHDPHLYAATGALAQAAESGEMDATALAELEKRANDPAFTTALLNAVGGTGYRKLLAKTSEKDGKEPTRLQTALGTVLGTASSRLSKPWRDQFTPDFSPGWQEAYGIALALKNGKFAPEFLLSTARKIELWNRAKPIWPPGLEPGVMRTLMEALSHDPAVAQDFFSGDPSILPRYLTERGMGDGGKALGKALEAATLTFRDHDGSPQNPSRGYRSAQLASQLIHLEAQRIEKGLSSTSLLSPTATGRILAAYISDVNRVATNSDTSIPGVRDGNNPGIPGQDPWAAKFKIDELRRVMQETFTDPNAFAPVLAAQTAFSRRLLDHGAAEMAAGKGDDVLLANAGQIGGGFGLITDAAGLAKIKEGEDLDEAMQRKVKLLTAAVNTALAIPQAPVWAITSGVVSSWTGMIEDSVKGDAETKARDEANSAVNQTRDLLHDLTAQAMLKHGLFGSAEPPAKNHPWASLEDLSPGDDPRDNPNNFLKDDGRTLMTKDEMIDKTATNSTDKDRRIDAYHRWLYQGPSGRPWREVKNPMDQSFSDGFTQYGS